jgi:hypothetical protein
MSNAGQRPGGRGPILSEDVVMKPSTAILSALSFNVFMTAAAFAQPGRPVQPDFRPVDGLGAIEAAELERRAREIEERNPGDRPSRGPRSLTGRDLDRMMNARPLREDPVARLRRLEAKKLQRDIDLAQTVIAAGTMGLLSAPSGQGPMLVATTHFPEILDSTEFEDQGRSTDAHVGAHDSSYTEVTRLPTSSGPAKTAAGKPISAKTVLIITAVVATGLLVLAAALAYAGRGKLVQRG